MSGLVLDERSQTESLEIFYKKLGEFEKNFELKHEKKNDENIKLIDEISTKIDLLASKTNEAEKNSLKSLNHSEKFSSFESTLIDTVRRLSNLEFQTELTNKNLKELTFKYDKIYLENLFIPGLIGENCRFKNMKEFVENQVNLYTTLMNFKEQATLDLKSNKARLDSVIKSNLSTFNDLETNLKSYSNLQINNYDKTVKNQLDLVVDRINEIRFENNKYAAELKNQANELKGESLKCIDITKEINENLETNFYKYKQVNSKLTENFNEVLKEFETIKRKFNETAEFIKDIRFRKNLQELNLIELRRTSKRIIDIGSIKDKNGFLPNLSSSNKFKMNSEDLDDDDDDNTHQDEEKDKINNLKNDDEKINPVLVRRSIGHFNTISSGSFKKDEIAKRIEIASLEKQKSNQNELNNSLKLNDVSPKILSNNNSSMEKEKLNLGSQRGSFRDDNSMKSDNISYFFDKLNTIKKDSFNRYKNCDIRINDLENLLKTSIQSLLSQIRQISPTETKVTAEPQAIKVIKLQEAPIKRINEALVSTKTLRTYGSTLEPPNQNSINDNFNNSVTKNNSKNNISTFKGKIRFSESMRSVETSLDYLTKSRSIGMKNIKKNI